MNSITSQVVYWSTMLEVREDSATVAKHERDKYIYQAFNAGERQKEIAMLSGLSESTVKHIIAAQRQKETTPC